MVLFLCMHAEHFGPRGINMRMAVAAKRSLGVSAKFIGGKLLTTGALAYVEPEKVLRTDGALQDAIAGKLTLAEWTKLVGLLNHLVCILLMPYYIMYDVYDISDACRDARLGPDDAIVTTPKGIKALRRWLAQLRSTAGTTALSAAFALRRAGGGGVVHALRSDAAILGTGKPAILGLRTEHIPPLVCVFVSRGVLLGCQLGARWCLASGVVPVALSPVVCFNMIKSYAHDWLLLGRCLSRLFATLVVR